MHNPNPNSLGINSLFSQTFLLNSLSLSFTSRLCWVLALLESLFDMSLSLPHQSSAHRLPAASHFADNSMSPLSISHLAILKILSHFESNCPSPSVNYDLSNVFLFLAFFSNLIFGIYELYLLLLLSFIYLFYLVNKLNPGFSHCIGFLIVGPIS